MREGEQCDNGLKISDFGIRRQHFKPSLDSWDF